MKRLSTIIKEKFRKELNSFPLEYSFEDFKIYNAEIDKHFENVRFMNNVYKQQLFFEKEYLKFIILKNSQLIFSLRHYFEKSKKAQKDYSKDSFSYKSINDFWRIFIVITNNYIVLNDLLLNGKDYQAKTIFRNTIELTEVALCSLGDQEFYHFFKKQNKTEDIKHIYQTVKFNTIKKTTQKIISEIKIYKSNNAPPEIWDSYLSMREEFYENTSSHIHSNFWNIMFGSYVKLMQMDSSDLVNSMTLNLGGIINAETKQNIRNIITYDAMSYMIMLILLIEKHKLFFKKLDKNVPHISILSKFNWDLLREVLK